MIGWLDTVAFDKTHDAGASQGWCPGVVDTNGDGKLSKEEFTKGAKDAAKSEAQFDKMQKDGSVSKEAFIAGMSKKKAK